MGQDCKWKTPIQPGQQYQQISAVAPGTSSKRACQGAKNKPNPDHAHSPLPPPLYVVVRVCAKQHTARRDVPVQAESTPLFYRGDTA